MAKVEMQKQCIASAIEGYKEVAIHSVMKPATLALRLYLLSPTQANLSMLNCYIDHVKQFVVLLKEKKGEDDIDQEQMDILIQTMEFGIADMELQRSKTPVLLEEKENIEEVSMYRKTINEIQKNLELQTSEKLETHSIIHYSLVLCNIDLQLVKHEMDNTRKEGNESQLQELESFHTELQKLKLLCETCIARE